MADFLDELVDQPEKVEVAVKASTAILAVGQQPNNNLEFELYAKVDMLVSEYAREQNCSLVIFEVLDDETEEATQVEHGQRYPSDAEWNAIGDIHEKYAPLIAAARALGKEGGATWNLPSNAELIRQLQQLAKG